jgi:hypothetical protein
MAVQFEELNDDHQSFIERQKMFFVATAMSDGRVNLSPKGQPSLAIVDARTLLWLNLTGSGNETAAHLLTANRITLMWCAFEGLPMILRVYGRARVIHPEDEEWEACTNRIPAPIGARQYFEVDVDLVQTSCGYAVPLMDYQEDRTALTRWAEKKGEEGIRDYWQEKNLKSLDGLPTRRPNQD